MSAQDPLYVGYLPLPAPHKRLLLVIVPVMMLMLGLVGAVVTSAHRDPGSGVWDTGASRTWSGRLVSAPFPMLLTDDGETLLIVEIGKVGAHERVRPLSGRRVNVEGYPIERDGRKMIELIEGEGALLKISEEIGRLEAGVVGESPVSVVGEIVDGKCFLGAMKPGDGKGHKACAILCIRGGMPPMVRTRAPDGSDLYALLLVDGSTVIGDDVLELVAETVRIEGTLGLIGDLVVISCEASGIAPFEG